MSVIEKAAKADYSEAEIERLKLEMKLKLFEIQATVIHIQDDYAQLQADNQRLRAALEVYADLSNWLVIDEPIYIGYEDKPWIIAQKALETKP